MDSELKEIPIGTWEVLREGSHAVILTFGPTIEMAMEAAENLEKQGKSIRVVNARFIKPLDDNMLHTIFAEGIPVLTIEEAVLQGGFGSAVLEFAQENNYYRTTISRLGIPDRFIEHGSVSKLLEEIGMTTENVVNQLKAMMPEKGKKVLRS
jgi:1-deoxy-D-xylulose-5-phosphate synthase